MSVLIVIEESPSAIALWLPADAPQALARALAALPAPLPAAGRVAALLAADLAALGAELSDPFDPLLGVERIYRVRSREGRPWLRVEVDAVLGAGRVVWEGDPAALVERSAWLVMRGGSPRLLCRLGERSRALEEERYSPSLYAALLSLASDLGAAADSEYSIPPAHLLRYPALLAAAEWIIDALEAGE